MKTPSTLLLALLFASSCALAADPVAVVKPSGKPDAVKTTVPAPAVKVDPRSAAGPVKLVGGSQQDRMRECNKSATGKKGAERKAFMKSCLSTRKG